MPRTSSNMPRSCRSERRHAEPAHLQPTSTSYGASPKPSPEPSAPQRAQDAYSYILKSCTNPQERLATIQKASGLLPYGPMQILLGARTSRRQRRPRIRQHSQRSCPQLCRLQETATRIWRSHSDYITQVQHLAETQGLASDNLLLGWYHLRRENDSRRRKMVSRGARQRGLGKRLAGSGSCADRAEETAGSRRRHVQMARRFTRTQQPPTSPRRPT
jgi:hypothetical protein